DMITYDVDGPREGLVELFRRTHLRKVPVYSGHVDNIIGVVHAKRLLLREAAAVGELVVKVPFIPGAASVERALMQFRVMRTQMAVVVDEYGGTAGLVTLEDVLEEIVGDIPDRHDVQRGPAVAQTGRREYLIDGDLAIHEWIDTFKMDLSGKRISTIGGFVTSLIGRIPRVGDTAVYRNLCFTVVSMRRRRVARLRLELTEDA
ncbi:MAG: CBS domain-containing protein, partial [Phycisphaerae bacterium]|nr:CBS domain-containing protein [Phycisphaerae bacterium]